MHFRVFHCPGVFSIAFSRTDVPITDVNTFLHKKYRLNIPFLAFLAAEVLGEPT